MSVESAVLDLLKVFEGASGSPEAATALALAREIDDPGVSATAKASCAKALGDMFDRLRALAPAVGTSDRLDEIARKRGRRSAA